MAEPLKDPWHMLPEHMRGAMKRYLEDGLDPGGFLRAVLENDLQGAIYRADAVNRTRLEDIVHFCQWHIPAAAWGSVEAVNDWIEARRVERLGMREVFTNE